MNDLKIMKKKIGEIKISEFEYNEDKELYLKSVENAKEKYKNLLENDIYYFRIYSKKLLKDFMDKIEKIKEEKEINKNSSDDTVKITNIIENNKIISDINLQKIEYNEYDYYKTEDYKYSSGFLFATIKAIYYNMIHDYNKDRKNHAEKIINEFQKNFNLTKNTTIKNVKKNIMMQIFN